MTRFGTVCPAVKVRLEASGWVPPVGNTGRSLDADGLVTVTLSTTAAAPLGGTAPLLPATRNEMLVFGPTGAVERVSRMRVGATALNRPLGPGVADGVDT